MVNRETHSNMPTMARLVKNRHGNTGSRILALRVTCRSQSRRATQSTTDATNNVITYAEPQGNAESASWKQAVNESVASMRSTRPGISSLKNATLAVVSWNGFLSGRPWNGNPLGITSNARASVTTPMGTLNHSAYQLLPRLEGLASTSCSIKHPHFS